MMFEIVKTVFLLSCIGAGITVLLLILKPWTVKKFSARWQYLAWLAVTVFMLIPVWKIVPARDAGMLAPDFIAGQTEQNTVFENQPAPSTIVTEEPPMGYREITIRSKGIRIYDLIAYVWTGGACLFLIFAFGSYYVFLFRKKRSSMDLVGNKVFEEVKQELRIKRKIRIRISKDTASPMLVGIFFPVIYIPGRPIDLAAERMIYRHELTHYKHKDLLYKWFSLIVNAIHWFNPFAYLVSANISEACEVTCDMSVIKNLSEQEQKVYMNTILDLVQTKKRRENNV